MFRYYSVHVAIISPGSYRPIFWQILVHMFQFIFLSLTLKSWKSTNVALLFNLSICVHAYQLHRKAQNYWHMTFHAPSICFSVQSDFWICQMKELFMYIYMYILTFWFKQYFISQWNTSNTCLINFFYELNTLY